MKKSTNPSTQTQKTKVFLVISDVEDDSLERLVRVAQSKSSSKKWVLKLNLQTPQQIKQVVKGLEKVDLIIYYANNPSFARAVEEVCDELGMPAFDIFDPIFRIIDVSIHEGIAKPLRGNSRRNYLRLIEAIEFAGRHDDGRNAKDISEADLVIIGVSRTSKTPLSLYLANLGLKVANIPLIYGVEPPQELFKIPKSKIVGLTISPTRLFKIRKNREAEIGLKQSSYASLEAIEKEVFYAEEIMRRLGCLIIDVTQKAIEESADEILKYIGWEEI
ncbi:MAG: kinase/pyrophosphorylase [Actinobacteria bacterium]|nr:kinase/pyrophosphorylase [Actinomycetota bacterium]